MGTAQSRPRRPSGFEHFCAIPWCAAHIDQKKVVVSNPPHKQKNDPAMGNLLWGETFNTPSTMPFWLMVCDQPKDPKELVPELRAFVTIREGITGWPGTAHGGIVATIMDEALGMLDQTNRQWGPLPPPGSMTAYLNTRYLAPVKAPGTIMVVARVEKIEGRKVYINGWMEDETGKRLAEADGLFLQVKARPNSKL